MDEIERAKVEKRIRSRAVKKVGVRLGFMWHAGLYVMVNIALVAINMNYSPEKIWFVWPLAAWGAALLLHAFATYSAPGMTEDMIQAEIHREMARRGLG